MCFVLLYPYSFGESKYKNDLAAWSSINVTSTNEYKFCKTKQKFAALGFRRYFHGLYETWCLCV
jgi:hypothetical protein